LSENAEYDAAKEEQGQVEARIAALEKIIKNAVLIDEGELRTDIVNIGSRVTLHDEEYDENVEYLIVGSTEADPVAGKISNESPLGAALLGSAKGATVEVSAPDGMLKFTILEIA
jgi:transcription elongation factor GreA